VTVRLTPHQRRVYDRVVAAALRRSPRPVGIVARRHRYHDDTARLWGLTLVEVGSAGALAHLAAKARLRRITDDHTPVYVLNPPQESHRSPRERTTP